MKAKKVADTQPELLQAQNIAYRLLTRRAHSRLEIQEKLQRRGFRPEVVFSIITEMETNHYINDRDFALAWAQEAVSNKGLGPLALQEGLLHKGVSRAIIDEMLHQIYGGGGEEEVALRVAKKRMGRLSSRPDRIRRQLMDDLYRKGFTSEVVEKVLQTIGRQLSEPSD